jgi:hypothetical protein
MAAHGSVSRKRFLALAGLSAGAVAAGCGGGEEEERRREARAAADLAIVRHLLDVERITSAFWNQVVERDALAEIDAGELARTMLRNEREHLAILERYERRLGDEPAQRTAPGFADIFAAGPREVLRGGGELADLAAAAYLGQLNRIQDSNLLASVLAIHSVEGRQAAAVNRDAGDDDTVLPDGAFAEPLTMEQVRTQIERFAT